ncbi:helix-turn-helix transcriptional regulator [Rhizobium sp. NPDC090279]|uniref:helix-turn-helix transcriptional regulator n=1 Tax=Rhizobium sp. NPDC090279 TaxID=3364499 RepID=UPI00383A58EB
MLTIVLEFHLLDIQTLRLTPSIMSTGQASEWLSGEKELNTYRPLSSDITGLFSFDAFVAGDLVCWSGSSSIDREFAVEIADDSFMFFCEHGSRYHVSAGSNEYSIAPGSALLTSADRYSGLKLATGSIGEGFCIPKAAINAAFSSTFDRYAPTNLEFSPVLDITRGPAAHLLTLVRFFRDFICVDGSIKASPIALGSFRETFCLLMLQNLQHSASNEAMRVKAILPRQVRRAVDFAKAYAATPINVSDMAAAADVSVRALQVNFQRFIGQSPLQYLRGIRLEGVRNDLVNADPSASVSEIARRWGFVNLGRFAQEYRSAFGVLPSSEMAKARPPFVRLT